MCNVNTGQAGTVSASLPFDRNIFKVYCEMVNNYGYYKKNLKPGVKRGRNMKFTKKKPVLVFIVSCFMLFFTGCQETPEEVQQFIDNKQKLTSNKETKDNKEENNAKENKNLEYDTVSNIFDKASEAFKGKYNNLLLKEDYTLYKPSSCGEWRFEVTGGFDKKGEEFLRYYIGEGYNEKYYSDGKNLSPPGPEYKDKENGIYAGAGENGFFIYEKDNIYFNDYKIKDQFLLVNGYEDAEYQLSDGKMKVSEAVRLAQKYADEWSELSGDFKYLPYRLEVLESDTKGEFLYYVEMQKTYENSIFFQIADNIKNSAPLGCTNFYITSANGKMSFTNQVILECEAEVKDIEQIVSLKSALGLISDTLSSYYIYEVKNISFENVLFPEEGAYFHKSGSRFVSKPYWIIYFKTENNNENYAAVNAVTGEVSYVLTTDE